MDHKTMMGTLEMGYFSWDIPENLLFFDSVFASMFEFSEVEGACGVPVEVFIDKVEPSSRERIAKAIYDALVEGVIYREEYAIPLKNGSTRWLRGEGRVIYDKNRNPVKGIGSVVDITLERLMPTQLTRQ